jgi:hypothetical protein
MKKKMVFSILAVFGLLVVALFAFTQTASACTAGCTPGYWKQPQHFDNWTYSTGDTIGSVFPSLAGSDYAGDSLLDALKYQGGGMKALLRHAVAALLNASYDQAYGAGWAWSYWYPATGRIDAALGAALANDGLVEYYKNLFESYNEFYCPLD